jgi:hypothetical protein
MDDKTNAENNAPCNPPGIKICSRRDCSAALELSYKLKACPTCLDKERIKDQNRRAKANATNDLHVTADKMACTSCTKILPMEQFASMKSGFQGKILRTCLACRQNNRNQDAKRDKNKTRENNRVQDAKPERIMKKIVRNEENPEKAIEANMRSRGKSMNEMGLEDFHKKMAQQSQKHRDNNPEQTKAYNADRINSPKSRYTSGVVDYSKRKGINLELTFDQYLDIVINPCHYCGVVEDRGVAEFNGVDRFNNANGFVLDNCVSCCTMCNTMKSTLCGIAFVHRVCHILTYLGIIAGTLFPDEVTDYAGCTYVGYRAKAASHNQNFEITVDEFASLIATDCYLCGKSKSSTHKNGIDRYDSNEGYELENCRSCCGDCNYMKNKYEYDQFIEKCELIHANNKCNGLGEVAQETRMKVPDTRTQLERNEDRRLKEIEATLTREKKNAALLRRYTESEIKPRAENIAKKRRETKGDA